MCAPRAARTMASPPLPKKRRRRSAQSTVFILAVGLLTVVLVGSLGTMCIVMGKPDRTAAGEARDDHTLAEKEIGYLYGKSCPGRAVRVYETNDALADEVNEKSVSFPCGVSAKLVDTSWFRGTSRVTIAEGPHKGYTGWVKKHELHRKRPQRAAATRRP
jgi:hypothetical protein